jgi:hypothetical protein
MRNKNRSLRFQTVFFILLVIFIYSSCHKNRPIFVAVRESDFRFGPILLPLTDAAKKNLTLFLVKGGDHNVCDYVDPGAPKRYEGLLTLLSDDEFLNNANNLKLDAEKKSVKISRRLKKWFRDPIVYQIVDATQKRPPLVNPISISDGTFWWVFYRAEDSSGTFRIEKLLVTLDIVNEVKR